MRFNSLIPTTRVGTALVFAAFSSHLLHATPYATCLTNNGDGTISFRLNQTTGTNDTVAIIVGTTTNFLQLPSADSAQVLNRGLITTNISIAPSTDFHVRIKHTGSGIISSNGPSIPFNAPRGICANNHPGSPYFGWVYVANGTSGTRGAGMFVFTADLTDILGQGNTAQGGGYTFIGGGSSPYHTAIAPDDSVLVTDWSDAQGNLIETTPTLSSFSYVLKQFDTNGGNAVTPVGANNNHGSVISAFIVGTGSGAKLYTMDEDYQTDPTASVATEINSAWEYDIGAGPLPWTAAPNRKLMTPYLAGFSGQNQKCEVYGRYLYTNQRRSNPPQHSTYITDLNNLQDPSSYTGQTPWDVIWTSQGESIAEGYSDDVLRDTMTFSVSPDQKWYATIIASGSNPNNPIVAPDGSTFTTKANDVNVIPLTNGIPNLPARQLFQFGGAGNGRDITFDAVHNLYIVSSGLGILQALDIGESTDVMTGTDGTFNFATPPTQVSVAATSPVAHEQGPVAGVFTLTRTPEDVSNPLTVFYSVSGTAKPGVNYVALSGSVVIPAGQTSADVQVTPIADGQPDPTLTVVLSVKGSGSYSVGFPLSQTVVIADNSTPQLNITGLSSNITGLSSNIFEGNLNDYAALTIQRNGDTNLSLVLGASDFTFGGTATLNTDFYLTNLPYTLNPGVAQATFPLIYPLKASTAIGKLSILVTIRAGTGYTVTNNTAATTITLEAAPPGIVLYSDDFENDPSGSNWKLAFQSYTNGSSDYTVVFGYDYTTASLGNLPPIPSAPHSTHGDTKGLYMTVNKNAAISAGLNLYLKNHTFSGNYALRFDLFLVENSAGTAQSQNENVLFGINHDGNHTNWFRNAVTGTSLPGSPTESDGLFFDIGADGNGGGGAPYDFAAWSGSTWTNTVNVVGPTNFLSVAATTTRQIFKRPPFDSGTAQGGDPANQVTISGFTSPTWVQVEVSQTATPIGNHISYKINNTEIIGYFNTNSAMQASTFSSGTVMVGYCDPWDDLANGSPGSGEGCAIIDNLRVVQLPAPAAPSIISASAANGNFLLSYTSEAGAYYVVQFKTNLTDAAWIPVATNSGTGGTITVTNTAASTTGFYRVQVQ